MVKLGVVFHKQENIRLANCCIKSDYYQSFEHAKEKQRQIPQKAVSTSSSTIKVYHESEQKARIIVGLFENEIEKPGSTPLFFAELYVLL